MSLIIVDIDEASIDLRTSLQTNMPPGVWGFKLGDKIIENGLTKSLCPMSKRFNVFVDLKHDDVAGRIKRIVNMYADLGAYAPKMLTISGDCSFAAIKSAVEVRGTIDIIVTTVLSDDDGRVSDLVDKIEQRIELAQGAGAQGITCPAFLLPEVNLTGWQPIIVATGVVSDGIDAHHHVLPRPLEFAFEHGATHVVVGTEVIKASDPEMTLYKLAVRIQGARKSGTVIDKVV